MPVQYNDVIYDGLWFDTFAPYQCYPYPYVNTFRKMPWFILEEWVHIDELIQMGKSGTGQFDLQKIMDIPLNSSGQNEESFRAAMQSSGCPTPEADPEMIRLQHTFTGDYFQTVANDRVMIRDCDNFLTHKQIPLVMGVKTVDAESFWPIGTAKSILANQKMTNHLFNSMADHVNVSRFWVWKHKSSVDRRYLNSLPNNAIPVKDMDDVDVIRPPEMKQDLMQFFNLVIGSTEEITGYYTTQKGGSPTPAGQPRLASLASIYNDQGDKRIQSDVMTMEATSFTDESKQCAALIQQFMNREVAVRIQGQTGPAFQRRSPDDIRGDFQYRVGGVSESMNRAVAQQQFINLLQQTKDMTQFVQMPNGAIVPVPLIDSYNFTKAALEPLMGRTTDKMLYRPELFGIPLSNDLLNQYNLPSIPGLDNLPVNPNSQPALGWPGLQNPQVGGPSGPQSGPSGQGGRMPTSVRPADIVNRGNRQLPRPIGVM